MAPSGSSISAGNESVVLEHGLLRVELALRPFSFTVRRAGRRLLRSAGVWAVDGTIHDHFVQFTEGVVAREERSPTERAVRATVAALHRDRVELAVLLQGGRHAKLHVSLPNQDRAAVILQVDPEPLRLAASSPDLRGARFRAARVASAHSPITNC